MKSPARRRLTGIIGMALAMVPHAQATLDWDTAATTGIQGGTGNWDTSATNWTNDGGTTRIAWDNTAHAATIARFGVSGGTVTVSGTINLGGIQSVGNINGYSITGGTLAFGSSQGSIDTTSLTTSGSNLFTINSALTGSGGLTIAASGNLTAGGGSSATRLDLLGNNTGLTGGIAITAGLVRPAGQDSLGSNVITLSNQAGIVATSADISLSNDIALSTGGGTIRAWSGRTFVLTGNLSGSGTLRKTDGGTVVFTGDNSSHTGGIEILGGILRVGNGGTTGNLGSGDILNNAGLRTNRTDTFTLTNNISGTSSIITEGTGTTNFTGILTSTGQLGVSNNGTMVINNASTNVGNTSGSDTNITGSLQVVAGNVNAAVLNFNSGTSSLSGGSITAASNVRIGNSATAAVFNQTGGIFSAGGTTYLADSSVSAGTHNLSGGSFTQSAGTYLIATRGTGVLNVSGTGALTTGVLWFGHNSVSGGSTSATINLNGGVIQAGRIERPGGIGTSIFNFNGGALRASQDNAFFLAGNNGSSAFAGLTRANVRDGGAVIDSNGFNITIGQALLKSNSMGDVGTGGLTKQGVGTLTLTGANDYEGATTISQGVIRIQHASALGTTAAGTSVGSGAALEIQGGITVGAEALTLNGTGISNGGALRNVSGDNTYGGLITLAGDSRINSDAGSLTLDVASGNAITGADFNVTFGGAGNITVADAIGIGTSTLTKIGTGTMTITSAVTYTGGTFVDEGVLWINSTNASSAVTVAGGTLTGTPVAAIGGHGTISGTLTLAGESESGFKNGGVLTPGTSGDNKIGTLKTGTTTWHGGGVMQFDLASTGTDSDKLEITGDFIKGDGSGFVFDFMSSTPAWGETFTLVTWTGSSNFVPGDFDLAGSIATLGAGPYSTSSFSITGNSLTFTAIPEPTTAFAGLLLGFGLLRRRRESSGPIL